QEPDIKWSMVGLPHGIGMGSLSEIEQIKFFTVGCCSVMGIGDERRGKLLDDLTDTRIAGRFPSLLCGNCDNLAMNGSRRARRSLQGQPFNQPYRLIWEVAGFAFVRAARISES